MNRFYKVTYLVGGDKHYIYVLCPTFSWAETKFLAWAETNLTGSTWILTDIALDVDVTIPIIT